MRLKRVVRGSRDQTNAPVQKPRSGSSGQRVCISDTKVPVYRRILEGHKWTVHAPPRHLKRNGGEEEEEEKSISAVRGRSHRCNLALTAMWDSYIILSCQNRYLNPLQAIHSVCESTCITRSDAFAPGPGIFTGGYLSNHQSPIANRHSWLLPFQSSPLGGRHM